MNLNVNQTALLAPLESGLNRSSEWSRRREGISSGRGKRGRLARGRVGQADPNKGVTSVA